MSGVRGRGGFRMPGAEFFARFKLFVERNFLESEVCVRVLSEARQASRVPALVGKKDTGYELDATIRNTKQLHLPPSTVSLVESRLLAVKPKIEQHFGLTLGGCQPPAFLAYGRGDFFLAHQDNPEDPGVSESARQRRVSAIIFLNDETEEPRENCYCGGSLTFYGLVPDPRAATLGFPLFGEAGLLIAFRSTLVHEVTPVTYGERYTIASWFF